MVSRSFQDVIGLNSLNSSIRENFVKIAFNLDTLQIVNFCSRSRNWLIEKTIGLLKFARNFKKKNALRVGEEFLCNNQINARALIGQSAVGYYAGKPTENSRVF